MKALNIGNLKAKLPIIQGGMGVGISLSNLAAAVANEGGIGVISAVAIGMTMPNYKKNFRQANLDGLRTEIRKARKKTDGILGVNIMMAVTDYEDLMKVAIDEKIDVIFVGAGLPLRKPSTISDEMWLNTETKIIPKVSSARAAKTLSLFWAKKYNKVPDAFVIEGPLAGGHLGFKKDEVQMPNKSLESIVSETVAELKIFEKQFSKEIPVIAGGGIYNGEDIFNIMQHGARAVKMGTRFVTTHECDASYKFKETYLNSKKEDITIIDSPVGLPGRVVNNDFVEKIKTGMQKPIKCPWKCLKTCAFKKPPFCIAEALNNAAKGNLKEGFAFAGSNAFMAERIMSVKETFSQLISEYSNKETYNRVFNTAYEYELASIK
ncbi:MAG: nitronate monooxygenase [Bacteroidales bacterium]|jgi:nitronate monooxygenase|nr:nitronate monooxygenase [Bacteroidales bacterium]